MRDKYMREKKKHEKKSRSGAGAISLSAWPLMPYLTFLSGITEARR